MAEKKKTSQAEKVASSAKSKNNNGKKTAPAKEQKKIASTGSRLPARAISSLTFLGLFILFLFAAFQSDGALIGLLNNFVHGLVGKVCYIVAIPMFLYLFIIHAFSGKRPVIMRTICVGIFVLLCGCLSHVIMNPVNLPFDSTLMGVLYQGGIAGDTGGLICGLLAMFLLWLCDTAITYVVLIIALLITLLGAMQITISSIVRAIQNRPRADWEDEEQENKQEPAAVVVNHIANKRIAYKENQRQKAEIAREEAEKEAARAEAEKKKPKKDRVAEIMEQIDSDVESPVAAASVPSTESNEDEILLAPEEKKTIPASMPILQMEAPIPDAPVLEALPELAIDISEPIEEVNEPVEKNVEEQPKVKTVKVKKVTAQDTEEAAAEVAKEIAATDIAAKPAYCFPPINLLKRPARSVSDGTIEMRENTERLNETLASFKIEAHIINVTRGPSVTRYEVELEKGVRLNKLTTAADDIALSLGAVGVRIAPVPGKNSIVGIEVPNRTVTTVSLREVIDSQEFAKSKSKSSFAVGKDISGNCIIGNIARFPHMLIAGTTGSGKSVCMNSLIISLLYKASPDDIKLIMVDPKMVELGIYNNIPHLLIPVVTDPKKAAGSLQWAVTEMMRRYKAMSDAGVRDLESYNGIIESQECEGTKLPQIVVIIDELADLMLVAAKEVEESICRIAQMGRAAGIHLIIATQRPSSDVITGLMKANIPSRIAFSVSSAMESRIILDTQGAEKLVGRGDMLFAPIGEGKPKRVQGCFVSDVEVEAVANYVKSNFVTNYDQEVMEEIEKKALQTGNKSSAPEPEPTNDELTGDEMLPAAVDVILEIGQASVSMLQRRLKLGYARAARIVDEMEEKGIVGPYQGSKPRAILITKEQWEQMKNAQPSQMEFEDLDMPE